MSDDLPIWPAGMPLITLKWGRGIGSSGLPCTSSLRVGLMLGGTPYIRWAANNQLIEPFIATIGTDDAGYTVDGADGMGAVRVPPVDAPGFVDASGGVFTQWTYSWLIRDYDWRTGENTYLGGYVSPLHGQTEIDLRTIPAGAPGSPMSVQIPAVTSVNGETGDVVVSGGGSGDLGVNIPFANVSSINFAHGFGRIPGVQFVDSSGNPFWNDYRPTASMISATFVEPTSGTLILT